MTLPTHRQPSLSTRVHPGFRFSALLLGVLAANLRAQEYWTNLTTGAHTLSAPSNWESGNTLTSGATDLRFFINSSAVDQVLGGAYTINNDLTGLTLNRLDLDGNSTAGGRSVAITGNSFTLSSGATLNVLNNANSGGSAFNYTIDSVSLAGSLTVAGTPGNGGTTLFSNTTLPGTAMTLTQSGGGRVQFNNATLNADHLFTGAGAGTVTLGGTLTLGGSRTVDVSGSVPLHFGGTITDGGNGYSITKSGAGLLTLEGANHTFTGGVVVNAGILGLKLNSGSQNPSPGGITVQNGSTVRLDWTGTPVAPVAQSSIAVGSGGAVFEHGSSSGNFNTVSYSGNFTGSSPLRVIGRFNRDYLNLTGDNLNYTGAVSIESATPFNVFQNVVTFADADARFGSASSAVIGVRNGGRVGFTATTTAADLANYAFGAHGGFHLSGASGALDAAITNPYSVLQTGGSILLDNRNASNGNRIPDGATVALNSGSLYVYGRSANTSPINESVGAISLAGGSRITLDLQNTNNSGVLLTASSLETPGTGESLLFDEADTTSLWGTAANNSRLVVTGSKPTESNGMLPASIQYYSGGNNTGEYLAYSGNDVIKATANYTAGFNSGSAVEIAHVSSNTTLTGPEAAHALRVSSGTLNLGNNTLTVGSGGVIMSSNTIGTGTLSLGSSGGVIGAYNAAAQAAISANISVSGGLTVLGATQTLNITGTGNTISGGIFLNGGSTRFAGTAANGNDVTVNTYGRLVAGPAGNGSDTIGGLSGAGQVSAWVAGSGTSTGTLIIGASSGSYSFDGLMGNGAAGRTLAVTKTNGATQALTYENTYTGATTINGGVLSIPSIANAGLPSPLGASTSAASNLVLGGGTLRFTGLSGTTDRGFTLTSSTTSSIDVSNASGTITLNGSSASTTGNLVKTGSGTLVLNGNNAHTGFTRIGAGTLRLISGGAILDTAPLDFAAAANTPTLDLAGFNRSLGQITNSGVGVNARINNGTPVPVTLSVGTIFGTASVFDGQIGQSGGGAVTLRVGQASLVPASSLNLGGSGGSTFTGKVQVQPNATLIVSSGQESSLGLATGADAIHLNGGTLRVEAQDLILNDAGRDVLVDLGNIGAGFTGGTFSVAPGRLLSIANTVDATGIGLRKADAGTLNLTGQTRAGTFTLLGGLTDIDGGDLRVNALNLSGGAFNWGSGRLSLLNRNGADGSTDYSSTIDPAGPEVRVGRALTVAGDLATGSGSVLELHGSPTFYENANIRFNQLVLSGLLDLTAAGDTLEVEINTTLLRGDTLIEYGSIPLVVAGQINGMFDTFGSVTSGGAFDQYTGAFSTAAALPDDTWYLQYADTGDVDALPDTLFFHYRLTPTFIEGGWAGVPEPGTFSLLGAGALALRALRRRAWRGDQSAISTPGPRRPRATGLRARRTVLRARKSKSW